MIDPAIDLTLRASVAALLSWSAVHKLRDLSAFAAAVAAYRLLVPGVERSAAVAFAATELFLAAGLLWSPTRLAASGGTLLLLAVYTGAIGINLARGRRDVDCGCFGPSHRQVLSEWLLVRNSILLGAIAVTFLPLTSREMIWVDGLGVGAACLTLAMLWAAAHQLLAQWPTVKALRRPA